MSPATLDLGVVIPVHGDKSCLVAALSDLCRVPCGMSGKSRGKLMTEMLAGTTDVADG